MSGKDKSGGHSSWPHLCQRFSVQVQHWETEIFPVRSWNRVFPRCRTATGPQPGRAGVPSNDQSVGFFYGW